MMRRFLPLLLSLCLSVPVFLLPLHAVADTDAEPSLSAASAILIDAATGAVLYGKDPDTRRPQASTTKIMTALLALESGDPDRSIPIPPEAVGVEGSSVYLKRGEVWKLRDLIYALMLASANDAAVAIAIAVSGSVEAFADAMNAKAAALSLTNTAFRNPNGLPSEGHYTTARDLANLTAAALRHPLFAAIVATPACSVTPEEGCRRTLVNHNRLLRTYRGSVGVKTGYTTESGRCLVSAARRDGHLLIAVTLRDPADWADHQALLDYGFSLYETRTLTTREDLYTVPVVSGTADTVTAAPAATVSVSLPRSASLTPVVELPRFLYAPVIPGQTLGQLRWFWNGQEIASVPLIAVSGCDGIRYPSLWERILHFIFRKD